MSKDIGGRVVFKLYTKHTMKVNETVFEHLRFTLKMAFHMSVSSFLLVLHGFTGGLFEMPDKFNICAMAKKLCEAKDDRLSREEGGENEKNT